MEVKLYVYDLSKGLAKELSLALLGVHIEAVYHTAIVFGGVEYLFGQGVQVCQPGSSHHGQPMEIVALGETHLSPEVISEYLESLKEVYTAESYDLFLHNCNNFSNDFATFLVGKGIPDHITSLPQTVLNTPFGQMLKPQLDQAMRSVTQAPLPDAAGLPEVKSTAPPPGVVRNVIDATELRDLLASYAHSCAVLFFTSSTCPPCKIVYPAYDELAEEAGDKAVLVKIDIGDAHEIAAQYGIRATPTFITFLKGKQENTWMGADEAQLRGNVRLLLQMTRHPHEDLYLPILSGTSTTPILFSKAPPLDKLMAKMGPTGQDPVAVSVKEFVAARSAEGPREAPLPDVRAFGELVQRAVQKLPVEHLFPLVDLLRAALADARFSGFFAEEAGQTTMVALLRHVNGMPGDTCPYALRLVTVQATCNLFSSRLYPQEVLLHADLGPAVLQLATTALLDDAHASLRVAASSLAFDMAAHNYQQRRELSVETMADGDQVELAASLLEACAAEESSAEALRGALLALGFLGRNAPVDGDLAQLFRVMDAKSTVLRKRKGFPGEKLVHEVGETLLGQGFP